MRASAKGYTDPDHPALAHQLFAAYARALRVRVLASVMGEQGLPESDRRFLAFGERFERQFVQPGHLRARSRRASRRAGTRCRACRTASSRVCRTRRSAPPRARTRMPDVGGEVAATRVALLELRDERRLVQEGYELLDEKRVLLATEILRAAAGTRSRCRTALDRLWLRGSRGARRPRSDIHGFDDLTVEPPCLLDERAAATGPSAASSACAWPRPRSTRRPACLTPRRAQHAGSSGAAPRPFARLTGELVAQAARAPQTCAGSIEEYRRTERRARALENVLLPEIDHSLRFIEEQLDAVDQEEAVRVRNAARGR